MKTVLIVDDSRTTQMLVKTTLQRIPDVQFRSAENGREALTLLEREAVDLVVTDINMPEMDGIALVREVRKKRTPQQLPIVIITAKGEEEARGEGMSLGANAYILKPLSARELVETTARLLDRQVGAPS
jgi:two-component system, chemotaxis family, chemotaxis protein CheY